MTFINMKNPNNSDLETVDEFKTYSEARKMLKEYRLSDGYNSYYLSQRSCKGWK